MSLSDLILDRYVAGELRETSKEREIQDHLSACTACAERVEVLRGEKERFPTELAFTRDLRALEKRARFSSVQRALIPIGAIAAVVLVSVIGMPKEPVVRTKGGVSLDVIAKHAGSEQIEELIPGAKVSPGDAIRFRVSSEQGGFLAVYGMDSAQVVSIYHPSTGGPVEIPGGTRKLLLDGSIVLDSTLGPEQLAVVVCEDRLEDSELIKAGQTALARAGGDPRRVAELELGCSQSFFLIEKVEQ